MKKTNFPENEFPFIMEGKLRPLSTINGKNYLYFAGTGYFQLQSHEAVVAAAVEALQKYGIGTATSRTINGTTPLLLKLESKIAEFFRQEDAVYLPSGYLSNLAAFQALDTLGLYDVIFLDESAHYSLRSGAMATGKEVVVFKHLKVRDLKKKIKESLKKNQKPLIATDGLFPIWAEIPPISDYLKIAKETNGIVWVDDAHGAGVLGENGRGVYEYFHLESERLFGGGTLSKAFGAYGGFVAGNKHFVNAVKSGHVMTGTSSPPSAAVGAALRGLELVKNNPEFLRRLKHNARYLKKKLVEAGISLDVNDIPIATFALENAGKMQQIQKRLMDKGIYIQFVHYVGAGTDGVLRMVVSSVHTKEEIDFLVASLQVLL